MKWILGGCCGCLLLMLMLGGACAGGLYFVTKGTVDAVQAELADLKAGRMEQAYGKLSPSWQQQMSQEQFAAFVASNPALKDHNSAQFWPPQGNVNVQNDSGHVKGVLVTPSGNVTASFELRKESGTWRITGIQVEGGQPPDASSGSPGSSGSSALQIETLTAPEKRRSKGALVVTVQVRVTGFALSQGKVNLVEDVETRGPDGESIPALTQSGVETFQAPISAGESARFTNDLTLDPSMPTGQYTVVITIHDRTAGTSASHEISFQVP